MKEALEVLAFILGLVLIALLLIIPFSSYSSYRSAELYNAQYGTQYTWVDFFWAKDQINTQTQTLKLIELKGLSQ